MNSMFCAEVLLALYERTAIVTAAKLQNKMAAGELLDDCISDGCRRASIAVIIGSHEKVKKS